MQVKRCGCDQVGILPLKKVKLRFLCFESLGPEHLSKHRTLTTRWFNAAEDKKNSQRHILHPQHINKTTKRPLNKTKKKMDPQQRPTKHLPRRRISEGHPAPRRRSGAPRAPQAPVPPNSLTLFFDAKRRRFTTERSAVAAPMSREDNDLVLRAFLA